MSVSRNFHMLGEITTGKEVENLIVCVSPRSSTWMLKSPVMMNSLAMVAAWKRNDENWLRKVKKGCEYGDGVGGR